MIRVSFYGLFFLLLSACDAGGPKQIQNLEQASNWQPLRLTKDQQGDTFRMQIWHYDRGEVMFDLRGWQQVGTRSPNAPLVNLPEQGKGRYLHFILNDKHHAVAHERNFPYQIPEGQHHFFALFSEDYHVLRRHEGSSMAKRIEIKNGKLARIEPFTQPAIAYHSPWGRWPANIPPVLDCAVFNPPQGYQIRYTLDQKTVLLRDTLEAYTLHGLEQGQHVLLLELLDAQGQVLYGPVGGSFEIIPPEY